MTALRGRLAAGETLHGAWCLLSDPVTGSLLAAGGADYVVLDLQHGSGTEASVPPFAAAVTAAGSVPLTRVRSPQIPDIGRALDLGAEGVFVPNVGGVGHVREIVAATRYGPDGTRSIGRLYGGSAEPLCMIVLETAAALADVEQLARLDGLDGIYVGPSDLSLALSGRLQDPAVDAAIERVAAACRDAGMPFGVHATDGAAAARFAALGATLVTVVADTAALTAGVADGLKAVQRAV